VDRRDKPLTPFTSLDHFRLNHFVCRRIQLDSGVTVDVEIQAEGDGGSTLYRIQQIIVPSSETEGSSIYDIILKKNLKMFLKMFFFSIFLQSFQFPINL
jgi:hypothetical protein